MNSHKSLRNRIIQATSWTIGGHISSQLFRLASNLIMTRLLVPEMFGIMAIASVVMMGLALMSDVGIKLHIIQSERSNSEDFLNTAWVVQIIRGVIVWIFAVILSWILVVLDNRNWWPEDSVYADPILPYVIVAFAFTGIIRGFESTKVAMANRNLVMNVVVKIELISQLIGISVMIAVAYVERSIWALVIGALVTNLLKVIFGHVVLPGLNNKFRWERESVYELLHFGKWIFLSSILGFLVTNGDRIILGGLIDSNLLGVYTIAIFIISAIQQLFAKMTQSVAFAALSEVVRQNPDKLKETYYRFRLFIDAIALFLVGVLYISGHHIIDFLYDDRYQAAGHMLQILSLLLIADRFSLTGQCFIALGKPSYLIPMLITRIPILYLILPIVYQQFGFDIALWVIALNRLAEWPILLFLKIKMSLFSLNKEIFFLLYLVFGIVVGWVINSIFLLYI